VTDQSDRVAQVIPDLATFAVDDGFAYRIPGELDDGLQSGSLVRVPLGSRRVRGYVVSTRRGSVDGLKPVISISGDHPVFDDKLLQTLRWAALHYVAPLAVLLGRAAPPNLPRGKGRPPATSAPSLESPLAAVSHAAAEGAHLRPHCLVASGPYADRVGGLAAEPIRCGRNVAVIAPTFEEAHALAESLGEQYGDRVLLVSSHVAAKETTRHWVSAAAHRGLLIVGTPEIALWPLGSPTLWIVLEEARRAMKSKQTPTLQVRNLVRNRAMVERTAAVFLGPVPTLDTLARGAEVSEPAGRVWPLVEVVDRREDPPGGRVISARAIQAIAQTVSRQGRVFVFVSRRGYAPAFRCVRCRELRRCPECGAGPDRGDTCRRCGATLGECPSCGGRRFEPLGAGLGRVTEQLQKRFGADVTGQRTDNQIDRPTDRPTDRQIIVGTERDLPWIPETALSVVVDADSLLLAPHYRAEEDAMLLLARVAGTVARGRGRRCLIQTAQPDHRVLVSLRRGHPLELLRTLGTERERDHLPPAGELLAVEVAGDATDRDRELRVVEGDRAQVHGPELGGGRTRWFLQGDSLHAVRVQLRSIVQHWRDAGLKVRIDADPIDL